jgi:hypothetical protein
MKDRGFFELAQENTMTFMDKRGEDVPAYFYPLAYTI